MYKLLAVQALRSDRIPAAALQFVAAVLGEDFLRESEKEPNMAQVMEFLVFLRNRLISGGLEPVFIYT